MAEMNSRQQFILQLVIERGRVSVSELAVRTGVSEVTIRHDLNQLDEQHYLQRKHGYAEPITAGDLETPTMNYYPIKRQLAAYAARHVEAGDTVFIDNGSCNALLAQILSERPDVTLVTVSGYIARHLTDCRAQIILLGGHFQQRSETMVGPITLNYLKYITFDRAFIGVDGWRQDSGFTGRDPQRCEVINALMKLDTEVVVLTDSSKFGASFPYPIGTDGGIERIITDAGIPRPARTQLMQQGIRVNVVNARTAAKPASARRLYSKNLSRQE